MIGSPRVVRSCGALAVVGAVAAAGVALLPASVTVAAAPPMASDSARAGEIAHTAAVDTLVTVVIDENIFSATRRAPATRWSAPGLDTAPPPDMPATDSAVSTMLPADSAALADPVPALYGTVVGDGAPRALLRLSPNDGAPRLYGIGDRHGGWRVVAISPRRVVLASRDGSRTVRLPDTEERP
ncbi:MAG: hypothetical protein MUF00_06905 [Gemmatimonadaceae bacterium]|jgi:hypothetical protein|nr:hypothetical protein [Gemmatimonadaceae bacterium]